MENKDQKWFESWFDTEYYHVLYNHRNHHEAEQFVDTLVKYLNLKPGSTVFDLACGKGRHSIELHSHGLNVLGLDLSSASITHAQQFENDELQFQVHDMRLAFGEDRFDAGFNLFTSFGYFGNKEEDVLALSNAYKSLHSGGYFIQDYINAEPILELLPQKGEKIELVESREIQFNWKKHLDSRTIVKDIQVTDSANQFQFQERVQVYSLSELIELHEAAGFQVLHVFGDYQLSDYDAQLSPRIVLISKK
jgi:SAM-dependent methyltransferase